MEQIENFAKKKVNIEPVFDHKYFKTNIKCYKKFSASTIILLIVKYSTLYHKNALKMCQD